MSNAEGIARVAFELDASRRAKAYSFGSSSWAADYGRTRKIPNVDAPRYDAGDRRDRNGSGDVDGEGRTYRRVLNVARGLWHEMNVTLCPGTKFFVVCVGIAAFIVVV